MNSVSDAWWQTPDDAFLQSVAEAYEQGRVLDAFRAAESFAPLNRWTGAGAGVVAARIAKHAGDDFLALRLSVRARRRYPGDIGALLQYAYELRGLRGPLAAWDALCGGRTPDDVSAALKAELLGLKAVCAAQLRDFAMADKLMSEAEAIAPNEPIVRIHRSQVSELSDCLDDALAHAREACALFKYPRYRLGVQTHANVLQLLGRNGEAIELLRDASPALQSASLELQLYALLNEAERWDEADAALKRYVDFSPLLGGDKLKWVAVQQAFIAHRRGGRAEAAQLAMASGDEFAKRFAARLECAPEEPERVCLDVVFVRQNFKTCAPATLAALGRFWGMPAEQSAMAAEMCYDGTPHWQQRAWAEANGWVVRDFRVSPGNAVELIAKGIPFAISAVFETSAHMMAVIGFDRAQGTLLFRDPGQPFVVAIETDDFLESQAPFGPHGTVFLPENMRHSADGIELLDEAAYDLNYRFSKEIAAHRRAEAEEILLRMEAQFPGHPLAWSTRQQLAAYDANVAEELRCLDHLDALFPKNATRLLRRLQCSGDAPREEKMRLLQPLCAEKDTSPALRMEYARLLKADARSLPQARAHLRIARLKWPTDCNIIQLQADICWETNEYDRATELYRFAANLNGFNEERFQVWFAACRKTRRTEEACAYLQERFALLGAQSAQPALTLAWAWMQLEQPDKARDVMADAIRRRPQDGILLLGAAGLFSRLGEHAEAARLLEEAKDNTRRNDRLRIAAEVAERQSDYARALALLRELAGLESFAPDTHDAIVRLLARCEGVAAAQAHLRAACERFPHHYGLRRSLVEHLRNGAPAAYEDAIRQLIGIAPADAWSRRELALCLTQSASGCYDEAMAEANLAVAIEPHNTVCHSVLGRVLQVCGESDDAHKAFCRAIELDVDNTPAIRLLLQIAPTDAARRKALDFVGEQLLRQVVLGDGLLAYREQAQAVVEPQQLLRFLRDAHRERPDLWHAWAALVMQLGEAGLLDEALDVAAKAVARFPHLPVLWLDLAQIHRWRNEPEQETDAAGRAFEMEPAWDYAAITLMDALERREKFQEAGAVCERAIAHQPGSSALLLRHAALLWRQHETERAFEKVESALKIFPGFVRAWQLLGEWSGTNGTPDRVTAFARQLAAGQPGEADAWLNLARTLNRKTDEAEWEHAFERAIALNPRSPETWDAKAELLANAEEFDAAIRVCEEGVAHVTHDAHILRGRHAWVEAARQNHTDAMRLIKSVLNENQGYAWGWSLLARWQLEQGAVDDAQKSFDTLRSLNPHDTWTNKQLAFIRFNKGDREGGVDLLKNVLLIDPADIEAAHALFDARLEMDDLAGAGDTLRVMRAHQPGTAALVPEIRLKLKQSAKCDPEAEFEQICLSPDANPWSMNAAYEALAQAKRRSLMKRVLKRALKQQPCNPHAPTIFARLLLDQRAAFRTTLFFLRLPEGEPMRRAAEIVLDGLAEQRRSLMMRLIVRSRGKMLARHDECWGHVGRAFIVLGRMRGAVRWLADWRTRANPQPWMLTNLCIALRHIGKYGEANAVATFAVARWEHMEGAVAMHLYLALDHAISGNAKEAQNHLRYVEAQPDAFHEERLLILAKALTAFLETPAEERRRAVGAFKRAVSAHFGMLRILHMEKDLQTTYEKAVRTLIREGGGRFVRWKLTW